MAQPLELIAERAKVSSKPMALLDLKDSVGAVAIANGRALVAEIPPDVSQEDLPRYFGNNDGFLDQKGVRGMIFGGNPGVVMMTDEYLRSLGVDIYGGITGSHNNGGSKSPYRSVRVLPSEGLVHHYQEGQGTSEHQL